VAQIICPARRVFRGKIYRCYLKKTVLGEPHVIMHQASREEYDHKPNWDLHWKDDAEYAFPDADGKEVEAKILEMGGYVRRGLDLKQHELARVRDDGSIEISHRS